MRLLAASAALFLAGWLAAHDEGKTSYKTATGLITLVYGHGELGGLIGNNLHAEMTGSPVIVTDTGQGLTVTGNSIDLGLLKLPKGVFALQSAVIKGAGHVTMDSRIADQARKETAEKARKPYDPPTGVQISTADSDSFSFAAKDGEGTILVPGAWTYHQDSSGTKPSDDKKSMVDYVESFDASGSSGEMHVFLKQDGSYNTPKNGHLSGPVKFKSVRSETDSVKKAPAVTDFTGSCDNLDMDFTTTPGTITAIGHVEVDGGEGSGIGHTTVDRLVVYVDKDLKVLRMVGSGSGKTTVTPKDVGH